MNNITEEIIMCDCKSYNWNTGTVDEVELSVPEVIREHTDGRSTVMVDACIAPLIKALWEKGLPTINSCCGHNKLPPSIVIPEHLSPYDYLEEMKGLGVEVKRWEPKYGNTWQLKTYC